MMMIGTAHKLPLCPDLGEQHLSLQQSAQHLEIHVQRQHVQAQPVVTTSVM